MVFEKSKLGDLFRDVSVRVDAKDSEANQVTDDLPLCPRNGVVLTTEK